MTEVYDIAIVGAGMAGASLAYFIEGARVLLLEAEDVPGYHTTGRSAAFWVPTYGGPLIEPLTTASKLFFDAPPPGFCDTPLLTPRGGLHLAPPGNTGALDALMREFSGSPLGFERLDAVAIASRYPLVRPEWATAAIYEPECCDIDVAVLHAGFLGGARRKGTHLVTGAQVTGLTRREAWQIETRAGTFAAHTIVNAAGAWGDELAILAGVRPVGLTPLRRTMVVLATDPPPPVDLPVVLDAAGSFYFKPDAGRIWVSPHDETADVPRDTAPEEIDIANAIDRFEKVATARVVRVERSWAGLRTFAPDRLPVYGFDDHIPDFFWCVGQGGFGIQTAPAAGAMAAALLQRRALPDAAIDPARYASGRFS
jgi:D-arginine dehydrogenase